MKKRIDRLLVERGFAETRERAQAMIMAGNVFISDRLVTKPGMAAEEDAEIRLKQAPHPYVSRGGVKLAGAVEFFGIKVEGRTCLDVGSSTGGFSHYLLLNGAAKVYALDVDIKQLDWKIRHEPRLHTIEMNARFLQPGDVGEAVDLVTIDASFISLTLLLPQIPGVLKPGGECLALVKPQFEVGRGLVGKGGIVRDEALQKSAMEKVAEAGASVGMNYVGSVESSIKGREGNREFFLLFRKP